VKIKTQFFLTMAVFGVTLAAIGVSLTTTTGEMSRLDRQEQIAARIGQGAAELSYLAGDYLLFGEEQQRNRWLAEWAAVSRQVALLSPEGLAERTSRDHLAEGLARMKAVFEDDVSLLPEDSSQSDRGLAPTAALQVAWSRLAVQSQSTAFEAQLLSRVLIAQKAAASRRNTLLGSAMLAMFGIFFVTNYTIVYRRVLRGLDDLRTGTRIVGSGDLDYAIPTTRSDEVGSLSRAFNRMTVDLKGVTASKVELEGEVAERQKAEVALRESLARIEVLSDERERELHKTKMLLHAAEAIAEWTDLDHVLDGLADIVLAATEHTRVMVHMWDEIKREMCAVVVRGNASGFASGECTSWDELSSPARDVVETMSSMVVDYDALSPERTGKAAKSRAHLGLLVPLVYRQRVLGLVTVDSPGERRGFEEPEIALIQGIAAQAAVAAENARHHDEERRVAEALRSVFQRPVPDIAGVKLGVVGCYASQVERVGGDFYDAYDVGDEVVVLIGDVAGKGLAAVGLTERVRSTVRALSYAAGTLSPSYLLGKANESLLRQLDPGQFVTAILLTLDLTSGQYRIARAGHPHPLICGDSCRYVETPAGPPLGVMEYEYEEWSGALKPNEVLVLHTDGVTEARRDSDFFGDQRLLDSLSRQVAQPDEIARGLYADVEEFARGVLADDLLIVALQLEPEPDASAEYQPPPA